MCLYSCGQWNTDLLEYRSNALFQYINCTQIDFKILSRLCMRVAGTGLVSLLHIHNSFIHGRVVGWITCMGSTNNKDQTRKRKDPLSPQKGITLIFSRSGNVTK